MAIDAESVGMELVSIDVLLVHELKYKRNKMLLKKIRPFFMGEILFMISNLVGFYLQLYSRLILSPINLLVIHYIFCLFNSRTA